MVLFLRSKRLVISMVPVRLVLSVEDEQYIEPFLHYVRQSEFDRRLSVTVFSRPEAFLRYMETSEQLVDVVLAENKFLDMLLNAGAPRVPVICLDEGGEISEKVKRMSKYQPLHQLLSAVLEYVRGGAGGRDAADGKSLVIGVYSAVGGCGKTTVAIHLVKQLARKDCKVFYLNLETVCSGSLFEGQSLYESRSLYEGQTAAGGRGLARLLYDLKAASERGEALQQPMSSYAYGHPFLEGDTFGPLDNIKEMLEMGRNDTKGLIDFIVDSGLYDAVVVDVDSYPNDRTEMVAERADKLIWLLADDWNVMRKTGIWMSHLEKADPVAFGQRMGKSLFVVNKCMGEISNSLPRPGMTAEIALSHIPSWNEGNRPGALQHSPMFQKDMLKLCRSVYTRNYTYGTGGSAG